MRPVTLLAIEDDDLDAELLMRGLSRAGIDHPLIRVDSAEKGLDILQGKSAEAVLNGPVLVLLDLNLPGMNGIEFLRRLRTAEDERLRRTLVFVLSTSDDATDRAAAYDLHVSGYLSKSQVGQAFRMVTDLIEAFGRVVRFP